MFYLCSCTSQLTYCSRPIVLVICKNRVENILSVSALYLCRLFSCLYQNGLLITHLVTTIESRNLIRPLNQFLQAPARKGLTYQTTLNMKNICLKWKNQPFDAPMFIGCLVRIHVFQVAYLNIVSYPMPLWCEYGSLVILKCRQVHTVQF